MSIGGVGSGQTPIIGRGDTTPSTVSAGQTAQDIVATSTLFENAPLPKMPKGGSVVTALSNQSLGDQATLIGADPAVPSGAAPHIQARL